MSSPPRPSRSRPRSPSAPPATSRPQSHQDIRVIPYSPPRISVEDISAPISRPVSYADADDPSSPPSSPSTIPNVDIYPWDSASPSPARPPARLRRYSSILSNSSGGDAPAIISSLPPSREGSRPPSSSSALYPRRIINININSDKTFSLQSQKVSGSATSRTDSFGLSQTTASSSFGRSSSASYADPFASSLTTLPEFAPSDSKYAYIPTQDEQYAYTIDSPSDSPQTWTRDFSRQSTTSSRTYDAKGKQPEYYESSEPASSPLDSRFYESKGKEPVYYETSELGSSPLQDRLYESRSKQPTHYNYEPASSPIPDHLPSPSEPQEYQVATKASLQSFESLSTSSETTNYKTYGNSSPVVPQGPKASFAYRRQASVAASSKHSANYVVIGGSSNSGESVNDHRRDSVSEYDSDANYVIHGGSNASFTSVVPVKSHRPKSEYSRESLTVPPLQPLKRTMTKSSSRESLRSLTSLSNFVTHEATMSIFAGNASIYLPPSLSKAHSRGPSASTNQSTFGYSHPWSKALSTVMSESEAADGASRTMSPFNASARRSSGFNSLGGSQHLSSSYGAGDVPRSMSQSLSVPPGCLVRQSSSNSLREIRDYDEDGDGLADLEELYPRQFRTRLGGGLSHSSSHTSLRRINSLRSSLPTWAKVYYSSEEPNKLASQPSMESLISEYVENPNRVFSMSRSPSRDPPTRAIQNTYLRPPQAMSNPPPSRHSRRSQGSRWSWRRSLLYQYPDNTQRESMEIRQNPLREVVKVIKKKTSSVWSPHLQEDKRASDYTFWAPPPAKLAMDRRLSGRRNVQIALFFFGFIFPFGMFVWYRSFEGSTTNTILSLDDCCNSSPPSQTQVRPDRKHQHR